MQKRFDLASIAWYNPSLTGGHDRYEAGVCTN